MKIKVGEAMFSHEGKKSSLPIYKAKSNALKKKMEDVKKPYLHGYKFSGHYDKAATGAYSDQKTAKDRLSKTPFKGEEGHKFSKKQDNLKGKNLNQ